MTAKPAHTQPATVTHAQMANAVRALAMDAVQKANSGHPGMPLGMADVATVLFSRFLKFDASSPTWSDRDRFVLSAGHGSMLLYSLLYLTGYEKFGLDQIKSFRQLGSLSAGHPEVFQAAGIETTTGPLGQGIATAVGMALAERMMNARFGDDLVDHHTYVIASDGDLMEGISHEACSLAGHLGLGRLIVLYDDNGISIDGPTTLSFSDNTRQRFESYGWQTYEVDGHNPDEIAKALSAALIDDLKPSLICCKTKIGFGAPTKQGSSASHGSPLGDEEISGTRKNLDWPHMPFEIPQNILDAWRDCGRQSQTERKNWQARLDQSDKKEAFSRGQHGDVAKFAAEAIQNFKNTAAQEKPKIATRAASGKVLEAICPLLPELVGGSADLTGSNLTMVKSMAPISREDFSGNYIYYGVREHAMAAAMNGIALHKGFIPYGGTFMCFSDYCRPSIRLSALMKQRVIYVMTHDSIGLGEDGPTHQPVEHMAALRAIPNLINLRPADAIETAECWQIALENTSGPSLLALTRHNLPTLRDTHKDNLCRKGAYVLYESEGDLKVTLYASGSEVEIAAQAREDLQKQGIGTRLVSVPCFELFDLQDDRYKQSLVDNSSLKVAVEAGVRQGWDRFIGSNGIFVGMKSFGESGPYEQLYEHFGITAAAIIEKVKRKL